ncbi:GNAT family N-acetyltransferase [Synechococcus sp. Nb3U1]|uniref:GNAT family N-acetyltransferase n=1 Tax=Synechococcus sp. Nb3U1 TaxID=1914529 RepID=UPI001F1CFA73|nr:GNAT family N-acetyltransferase [Synechococcus sp. Nb3U1]MCF2969619.1 GNAT family N-acetyltransferase [Synechococcus sp. Nb3U1]
MGASPRIISPLYRQATPQEDLLLGNHFLQLWRDNGFSPDQIRADGLERILSFIEQFIEQARQTLQFQAFVAQLEGQVVGSVGCQLFTGLYPLVLREDCRKYGYIWGVYVEPDFRRRGIARQLTQLVLEYLHSIGCTRAILHASPSGRPVYEKLGFVTSSEMRLDLI